MDLFDEMERDMQRMLRPAKWIIAMAILGKLIKWGVIFAGFAGTIYIGAHFVEKYW